MSSYRTEVFKTRAFTVTPVTTFQVNVSRTVIHVKGDITIAKNMENKSHLSYNNDYIMTVGTEMLHFQSSSVVYLNLLNC